MGAGRSKVRGAVGCLIVAGVLGAVLIGSATSSSADTTICTSAPGPGQCKSPEGLAVDRESELLYVCDSAAGQLLVFKTEGGSQTSIGTPGSGPGQLERPKGVAVDNSAGASHHDLYVTDNLFRVQKFNPAGAFIEEFGEEGKGKCQLASEGDPIAVGPGGVVYVADSARVGLSEQQGFNNRIEEFDESGACLKEVVLGVFADKRALTGLAVDSSGNIYVTDDSGTDGIRKYDGSGNLLYHHEFVDSPDTTFLALDGADNLFAVEREEGFRDIAEYDAAGNPLHRFGYGRIQVNLRGIVPFHSATGEVFGSEEKSAVKHFALSPPGPVVVDPSLEAKPIGNTKATLNALINPEGKATEYHFEYVDREGFEEQGGFTGLATKKTAVKALGSDFKLHLAQEVVGCPVASKAAVEEGKCLNPSTVYHFRVIATNSEGEDEAEGPPFETKPPLEFSTFATEVGVDTATLGAELNPLGIAATGRFQYVDDASFNESGFAEAIEAPSAGQIDFGQGEATLIRHAVISPLTPGTTYHYRLIAEDPLVEPIVGPTQTLTTFAPLAPGQDGPCPNEALRPSAAAFLADCRAYEMVSPLDKNNGDVIPPNEGSTELPAELDQSSVSGQRLTYSSFRAFGDAQSAPYSSQYIAARDPEAGWRNRTISPPRGTPILDSGLELDSEFKAFSPDLCNAWIRTGAEPPLAAGAIERFPNLYRRQDEECGGPSYEALTTVVPTHETSEAPYVARHYASLELDGLSADGAEAIYVVAENLTENAPPQPAECLNDLFNGGACELRLYLRSAADGGLHYVCVLPSGVVSQAPCAAGWPIDDTGKDRLNRVDNAISEDGSRIFWTSYTGQPNSGRIYLRENPAREQSEVSGGECTEAAKACTVAVSKQGEEESGENASRYWGAAKNGSKAIFTSGEDLYEFAVDAKTTHLIAHKVGGVMGASEDASYVYFASKEDLGAGAVAGQENLYLYHEGTYRFVAALAEADVPAKNEPSPVAREPRKHIARVSADGLQAAFMSLASPTGYDNKDANNGKAAAEVYLYDASAEGGAGKLVCASCNPSGARPVGANILVKPGEEYWAAAKIPVPENTLYAARVLSEGGKRLYFAATDTLSPRDTNGRQDLYQWEAVGTGRCDSADPSFVPSSGGCLSLISTGKSASDSEFVDASPSGENVFFSTLSGLVPQDYGLVDIYDARVDGGFPEAPAPKAECEGEACQSPPAPPQAPTPSSSTFEGAGNVKEAKKSSRCGKGRQRVRRGGKSRCVKAHKKHQGSKGQRRAGR